MNYIEINAGSADKKLVNLDKLCYVSPSYDGKGCVLYFRESNYIMASSPDYDTLVNMLAKKENKITKEISKT